MNQTIKIRILRPNKEPAEFDIEPGVYTIGSDADCKICLNHNDVEPRHAILTLDHDNYWLEDLDAETGTCVNNQKISGRIRVFPGHCIGIGPFSILVQPDHENTTQPPPPEPNIEEVPPPQDEIHSQDQKLEDITLAIKTPPLSTEGDNEQDAFLLQKRSIKQQIHQELVKRLDIKRMTASKINKTELEKKARNTINSIVQDVSDRLPQNITPAELAQEIYDEALRLGPLEAFLDDPEITEIMVNGPNRIYVEKKGKLTRTNQTFMDSTSVLAIIERIVAPIGRRIDESQPYVDARLEDGSRVNAIIHPLSLIGPCLTIRKFSKTPFTDKDLINFKTLTPYMTEFIQKCVLLRKNIIVSGGTGSGKTSLLNVISNYLPESDRIITIEDAAELRLGQDHVVRLESRPPNIEGKGAIAIRDLVRNALRMRPDRIVVGECRGGETLDMLQAMNTGHDGSLTTVHANTPRDVISRLETMVLMSGIELPVRAIREQVAAAVDVIVHESRFSDGSRKVTKITEVVGLEGDQITMQDIFEYKQTGIDEDNKVIGHFQPTGSVPTFLEELRARGMTINQSMFNPNPETNI